MFVHIRNDLKRVLEDILGGSIGGGFKDLLFSPTWGNDPIWRAYFSNGLVQPPARIDLTKLQGFHHSSFKKKSKTCVSRSWCSKAVLLSVHHHTYCLLIYIYKAFVTATGSFPIWKWSLEAVQNSNHTKHMMTYIYIYIDVTSFWYTLDDGSMWWTKMSSPKPWNSSRPQETSFARPRRLRPMSLRRTMVGVMP